MKLGLWTGWLNSLDTKVNTFVFNKLPVTVTVTVKQYVSKILLLVKMKEKKLLKMLPLPKVLRVQAIRATT